MCIRDRHNPGRAHGTHADTHAHERASTRRARNTHRHNDTTHTQRTVTRAVARRPTGPARGRRPALERPSALATWATVRRIVGAPRAAIAGLTDAARPRLLCHPTCAYHHHSLEGVLFRSPVFPLLGVSCVVARSGLLTTCASLHYYLNAVLGPSGPESLLPRPSTCARRTTFGGFVRTNAGGRIPTLARRSDRLHAPHAVSDLCVRRRARRAQWRRAVTRVP